MIDNFIPFKSKKDTSRQRKATPIVTLTDRLLFAYAPQFGPVYVKLLKDWPNIIGENLAQSLQIATFHNSHGNDRLSQATLVLFCPHARIPMIHMQTPQILERINQYFGYKAVAKIKLEGKPFSKKNIIKTVSPDHISIDQIQSIQKLTDSISDQALQTALNKLGESLYKNTNIRTNDDNKK